MSATASPSRKEVSPFAQAALDLDEDFGELERLSAELERLNIESDSGFDRAKKLLARFSECGERIGTGVQALARELNDARARAEKAAELVAARAAVVQQRQQVAGQMLERFSALGEMVRKVTSAANQLQKPAGGTLTADEKALLAQHLPEMTTQLGVLIEEARKLEQDAQAANLKTLARDADALAQSLAAARRRLAGLVERPADLH